METRADPRGGKGGNCPPPLGQKKERGEGGRKTERKKNSQFEQF